LRWIAVVNDERTNITSWALPLETLNWNTPTPRSSSPGFNVSCPHVCVDRNVRTLCMYSIYAYGSIYVHHKLYVSIYYIYLHICTYMYIYLHIYIYTYIHIYIHINISNYMYIYIHICTYTNVAWWICSTSSPLLHLQSPDAPWA
jgi:hypothetical protein